MTETQRVHTLTVRGRDDGLDPLARKLDGAAASAQRADAAVDGFTATTEQSARRLGNIEREVDRLQKSLAGSPAAFASFEKGLGTANRALEAGKIDAQEFARLVSELQAKLQRGIAPNLKLGVDQTGLSAAIAGQQKLTAETRRTVVEMLRQSEVAQKASDEVARANAMAAAEAARHTSRIEDLRAAYDPAYDAARRMGDEIARLAELERAGVAIMGGYEAALDKIILKYDEGAQAAARAAAAQAKFIADARSEQAAANARFAADRGQEKWNFASGIRPSSNSARDSAGAFEAEFGRMEKAAVELRSKLDPLGAAFERMSAQVASYNDLARRGFITQEELAQATSKSRQVFDDFSSSLHPVNDNVKLTSNQLLNLSRQGNDVITMFALGANPMQVFASQAGQVVDALQSESKDGLVGGVNALINSAKDGVDYVNALASGTQSLAAVGGRFSATRTALAGLAGSLGALALNPVILGFTALAGVLVYVAMRATGTEKAIKASSEAMSTYKSAVEGATQGNSEFASSIEAARSAALTLNSRQAQAALAADLEKQTEAVKKNKAALLDAVQSGVSGFNPIPLGQELYRQTAGLPNLKDINEITESLASGAMSAAQARAELQEFKVTPNLPDYLKKSADSAILLATNIAEAEANTKALTDAADRYRGAQADSRFDDASAKLKSFGPDSETEAQKIERAYNEVRGRIAQLRGGAKRNDVDGLDADSLRQRNAALKELSRDAVQQAKEAQNALANLNVSPDQRSIASIRQRYDAEIAGLARVNGSEEALAAKRSERDAAVQAASTEAARTEAARRKGYELDLRAVTAITAAQKAQIEGDRVRADLLGQGYSAPEAEARAQEASALSLATARQQITEATRQQTVAGQRQIEQAQLEIELVGKSAGETARLRAEFDALAQAKDAARSAGFDESTVTLTDKMREQATAIGEATDALEKLNFQRDLQFRLQQAGRSEQDQRIAEQLRGMGIEFDSAQGQITSNQLRYVESVEKTGQALRDMRDDAKDAFGQMLEGISAGEGAMSSFITAFAGLGRKMAGAGFDKLWEYLSGTANLSGSSAGIGVMPTVAKVATSAARIGSDYVASQPLAALNDNLAKSATSALAVAKQFDGLNERADSKVLDSFMQASGTWRNLSAADTAWCASFANAAIVQAGGKGTGSNLASSFLGLGTGTNTPQVGDIVVLKPQTKGSSGHVGFVAGFGDGTVQVFGGNQSGGANTKSFGIDQVAGYRTGFGVQEMTKAVADGNIMSAKSMAAGAVPGVAPYKQGGFDTRTNAQVNAGMGGGGLSGLQSLLQSPVVKTGLAGLGAFASGMESGSPIGGALGGALSGFAAGGPLGAVVGGIAGLVGGIFGKSKQKKAAKKAKRDQARAAWDQNIPALHDLQDHVNEVVRGSMSEDFLSIDENIAQFAKLAKDTKRKEDTATVSKLQKDAEGYKSRTKELFRDTFAPVTEDLSKGLGLDSEFVKARDGVKKTAEAYRGFIGDVELAFENPAQGRYDQILATYEASKKSIESAAKDKSIEVYGDQGKFKGYETVKGIGATEAANRLAEAAKKRDEALAEYQRLYGDVLLSREEAIRKATEAARDGLLRIVSGDVVEQTDVDKALDQSRGAAASLAVQLTKLGMTADEAGVAIEKALADRLKRLKKDFEDNLKSQINDLDGVGYLNSTKDLVKEFTDLMVDAGKIGADTSLVTKYFKLSAQGIVDGAELTGTAFADLIKQFPELTGVVGEFGAVVKSAVVQDGLKAFLDDRLAEATQKKADAENELLSVYRDQADHLEGFSDQVKQFLKDIRLGDASPLSQKDQFLEAQKTFRDTQAKAMAGDRDAQEDLVSVSQDYLDAARNYYASSEDYFASFNEVESSLKSADSKAMTQLDVLKQQVGALVDIDDGVKSVEKAIAALTDAIKAQKELQDKVDAGRSFGKNPERNRLIDAGVKQLGFNFTGSYGVNPKGIDEFYEWRRVLPPDQLRAVEAVISQYIGINRQMGGLIPGFVQGGVVGNGVWNKDSVLARYANGGSIGLAGGEMVVRAPSVTPRTYPVLDAINRTGAVPVNDNRGSSAEMAEIVRRLDRLTQVVAAGMQMTTDEIRRGNRTAEDGVSAQRRKNAA